MRVHARDSKVLVKDIKRCKVIGGWSTSSPVGHKDFGRSECLDRQGQNSACFTSYFFSFSHTSWRLDCTYSSVLVDLSKNVAGVCRGVCEVGNRTSARKHRCCTPIQQPLLASVRVHCERCAESISCDPSERWIQLRLIFHLRRTLWRFPID